MLDCQYFINYQFNYIEELAMRIQPTTYRSKLYRDFRNINPAEYSAVVRFYERNEGQIAALDFEEYVELLLAYTNALFELGLYNKHLRMADIVIEISIVENLRTFNGEELYENMLFKKASSHFHLKQYEKTQYILKELIKINPQNATNLYFLEHCIVCEKPAMQKTARAVAMVLLLTAAVMLCVEMIVIRPLFANFTDLVVATRNILFGFGGIALAFGFLASRLIAKFKVYRFRRSIAKK